MKTVVCALLMALALLTTPTETFGAVLGTYTHDYGRNGYVPQGNNRLRRNYVLIDEGASQPFYDSFDFSELAGSTIDSITLTLDYTNAGPLTWGPWTLEGWNAQIQGTTTGPTSATFSGSLDDTLAPQTFVLDATTDGGGNTSFADAVSNLGVGFWFDEPGFFLNNFRLYSASLTVNGTAPAAVPLPAPVWLLLSGLFGLGVMRRFHHKRPAS